MAPWTAVIALLFAFCLDRWFGEPVTRWHPVGWMGKYLGWMGGVIAPREAPAAPDWRAFWAGALAWYGGAVLVGLLAYLLQSTLLRMDEALAGLLLGALLKPMLSWRMLRVEVMTVESALTESLDAGRRQLGRLVSREVMRLDEHQVRESAIESLAENLCDSVVAPVFWFLVAGLPGAVIYRFANTADAMWGYRGFRAGSHWEWAGKWAARADDLLSWLPARITALLIAALAGGLPYRRLQTEASRTPSPNSGWPMAAMALALGRRLRKPGVYALNESQEAPAPADTGRALKLADHSVAVLLAWTCLALFAIALGASLVTARCVMVLGTTSGAGKSWLATALCRWYARQGLKVTPFKAQNMSNNARVVAGGEIGSAQYFQALAARAEPEVRMNPLLLKPERDTHSQVVLLGQVNDELSRMPWRGRSDRVWPVIAQALDGLRAENDVVVIEGAGSPAEINLAASDIVNMRVAEHGDARCLLVTDIDRGGAFAHLYGTWALLEESQRKYLRGFVLNKFRGDASLLAPGPEMLQELTGIATVATLPMWWQHGLPEEDGVFDDRSIAPGPVERTIAVVAYPRISNLDEFQPLKNVPGVRLVWARSPADVKGADWIILPGSKHTSGDLAWLRAQGLDRAIAEHAQHGGRVLGVCGGLQMLGEALIDTHGIDGNAPGLGLLPLVTVFDPVKTVKHTQAGFLAVIGPWAPLGGLAVRGYEIHHGQTSQHPAMAPAREVMPEGLAWQNGEGNVLGVYLHGLFEDPAVLQALFGGSVPTLDSVFDGLADFIDAHFAPSVIADLIGGSS